MRAKYLGQLTTRLYIVLLIIGLAILILYSVVKPPVKTETIEKPSFDVYERLIQDYKDTLRCPCTFISSTYDQYITMKPKFHQICTSSFVLNKWRHIRDPSIYAKKDYRLFLLSHLHFLTGLCNQSIQSVDASVYQFLSSLFITPELLSKVDFNKRIDLRIEQSKESAPRMFTHLLRLLRDTNHGNAIISSFGTNFEYIDPFYSAPSYIVDIQAINYDGCSCGLYANCTIQATLVDGDYSSKNVPIMGLKMGCTPTESFLASNLACFYNSSCIKLIYDSTNYDGKIPNSLSIKTSRFSTDTPVINLVNELFIENWSITIEYPSYFNQCSPSLCSYTYTERINLFYTGTLILGIYGGLSFVLKWFCPLIIRLLFKLNEYRKKRGNHIGLTLTDDTRNIENTEISVEHSNAVIVTGNSTLPSIALPSL
ncbi:unnamed protein product [Adineta steineri]|uniref:Uncharacterized protein n=1 Tax=Adineta steineri TaxID=433720 RepID=A0A815WUL6_9BILA|nr:unnamed protein product [Adineta steineri]